MLIFWEKDLVFLANPKAGSTAIEAALEPLANLAVQRPPELKHANLSSYRQYVAPWLASAGRKQPTTIAVMREPVDWLRSWYRFRIRDDVDDPEHEMTGVSFTEFVKAYMAEDSQLRRSIGNQSGFLTNDGQQVDRIFRYEDMDNLTHFMEERLDCALHLPRVNVPPSVDVALEPALEGQLREFLNDDVKLYASLGVAP